MARSFIPIKDNEALNQKAMDAVKQDKLREANKESIICGWKFIYNELKKNNCSFVPIDSEHFSIFNLIENKNMNSIKNIYLTASGGPFFGKKINLKKVTPLQAIKHPNWKMGKRLLAPPLMCALQSHRLHLRWRQSPISF